MSIDKVLSIQVESNKNSTSVGGDVFANLVQKIKNESSDGITNNLLLLQDNHTNNKANLSGCSEPLTNVDLSNNNNVINKSHNESKETLVQNDVHIDKRKNQIKKEKPSKLHITFIDKIPPFLPLATIIDIQSYKKTSLYNSFSDNEFDKSSNQKPSKNKCCLLI
jgi:hypothetical protein